MNPKDDFDKFLALNPVEPPSHLSDKIISEVHQDLNPKVHLIFTKLTLTHLISSCLTLSLCPQFGFSLWGGKDYLMKYFMLLGHYGCMFACGLFFIGTTFLFSFFVFSREEMRAVRQKKWIKIFALVVLSLGTFFMFDRNILLIPGLIWSLGCVVGALGALHIEWVVQSKYSSHS